VWLKVSLKVERLYGSLGAIRLQYRVVSVDELGHWNFHHVRYSFVSIASRQVTATITVQVTFNLSFHCLLIIDWTTTTDSVQVPDSDVWWTWLSVVISVIIIVKLSLLLLRLL